MNDYNTKNQCIITVYANVTLKGQPQEYKKLEGIFICLDRGQK